MRDYIFGAHQGHLNSEADRIAARHGAVHVNHTERDGSRRGWFVGPSPGKPDDQHFAEAVWRDIERAGGLPALMSNWDRIINE